MSAFLTMRRRDIFRSFGLGVGSWFLPSLLGSDRAVRAATIPKRLVIVWSHHGTVYGNWKMRQGGADTANWSFPLTQASPWSRFLSPLKSYADKLLVVDGLAYGICWADPGPGNEHSKGQSGSLTGAFCAGDSVGGAPSIDQIVASGPDMVPAGGLRSLELHVGGSLPATWSGKQQRLPSTGSAQEAFQRLFPLGPPAGTAMATIPVSDDRRIALQQSKVIKQAQAQFDALKGKVSKEDAQRLTQHRDLLTSLYERFAANEAKAGGSSPDPSGTGGTGGGPVAGGGTSGGAGSGGTSGGPVTGNGMVAGCHAAQPKDVAEYKAAASEMIKVIVAGLSCDQTRVASLQLSQVPNGLVGVGDGVDLHNEYIHDVKNERHPDSVEVLSKENDVYAGIMAELIGALAAIPEGGGSMLDNTCIVWAYELATGDHDFHNVPVVIAGNVNGYFKTGQYVHYAETLPNTAQYDGRTQGPPHNKYLVTVANAFGVNTNSVGEKSMQARNGTNIDCTGALPELKA